MSLGFEFKIKDSFQMDRGLSVFHHLVSLSTKAWILETSKSLFDGMLGRPKRMCVDTIWISCLSALASQTFGQPKVVQYVEKDTSLPFVSFLFWSGIAWVTDGYGNYTLLNGASSNCIRASLSYYSMLLGEDSLQHDDASMSLATSTALFYGIPSTLTDGFF